MHKLAILALLAAAPAAAQSTKKYTLPELKALVDAKSYDEAIRHLGDVSPQDRKADWIDVAGKASVGFLNAARADDKLDTMLAIEREYPLVLSSQLYVALRAKLAPDAFAGCFRGYNFQDCRDWALTFVDADPKNGTLQLAIAKVVRRGMSHFASVPFWKRALAANKATAVCPDDDLELAVISGLALTKDDDRLAMTNDLANACWQDLRESVQKLTWDKETNANACALLKAHKEANKRCP